MKSGVYTIRHRTSDKCYVGSSSNIYKRWRGHISLLNRKKHDNPKLQSAWSKYGQDDFHFSVILHCSTDRILIHEQGAIDSLKPWFNVCKVSGTRLGARMSDSARARISQAVKGRPPMSAETRAKISRAALGNKNGVGFIHSLEERARRSERMKGSKINVGRIFTLEHRARLSVFAKGRVISPETRKKISQTLMGNRNAARRKNTSGDQCQLY